MIRRFAVVIALALMLAGCKRLVKVPTAAMEPTIKAGDSVVADPLDFLINPVRRFDIVVFKAPPSILPGEKETFLVKRVIGLGDEQVELRKGKVFINGQLLNEPFTINPSDDDFGPVRVPSGEYFMLGDNRPNSYDSRYWNPATLKESYIGAKVIEIRHSVAAPN
jgi:signal peptidase I